ncbi:polysaccharide deacetylase family protein [Lachnoclostridium sp.]|uniref:polysaccharide deacetylase family protein n=1 Tax=Lachnoclostridium sp. TaxID=2028282 RepID=UPI00289D8A6D|nr:polysaccharide deacetylase family protein [Lachnoclostridium sp.]
MQFEIDKEKLGKWCKTGILVLSIILVIAVGVYFVPKIIAKAAGEKRELTIYCVKTEKKQVALSFDAAWGNEDTARILEILKKQNVNVTFFMTGGWIEKYPDDVKAIAAAGHDLGNHSENHKQMSKLSKEQSVKEIMTPHDKVKTLTGKDMQLFRPPFGDYNNTLIQATKECGYYCIQWDVDSLDWKDYGKDSILKQVLNNKHLGNGSIILCHNGAKFTADALEELIVGLKDKGYEIVPISKLIYTDNFEMDHEGRQVQK